MKRKFMLCILICFTLTCSCNKSSNNTTKSDVKSPNAVEFLSPYTGENVSKKSYCNYPFFVIVENSKASRPQSGLIDADIVFETMAEGGIPRFMALYHKNLSKQIGPVRSARPYFLDIASQFKLPFAHCGYSEEAKNLIEKNSLPTLNEFLYGSYYWRDKSRKNEHSLYTSSENLSKLIEEKKLISPVQSSLKFDKNYWTSSTLNTAKKVHIKVNKYYNTSYTFKDNIYYKSMDSVECKDLDTQKKITTHNIVIQLTNIKLQKDKVHIDIQLTGEGDCYILSNGKFIKGKWIRKNSSSPTLVYDKDNKEIPLNLGNTWWHILDKNTSLFIE
ncbi:DUF3048 domain-containing protein [Clostridium rectalis]|uniref:DUF3048 domain-containing protein n=1 Tax=Clostridium rectalis TaxID=2040295 RepID=UPI000F632265|nr:DUF3048 domain-containing protein [Clostridium rectalis]